jgi:hypothetical protein
VIGNLIELQIRQGRPVVVMDYPKDAGECGVLI